MVGAIGAGQRVADRFAIEALMGHSSRCFGFRARELATRMPVALSLLEPERADSPEVARWLEEARRLTQLTAMRPPAIAACLGYGWAAPEAPNLLYMATEWPDGEDLKCRLARQPLTLAESLGLVHVLGEGLAALHRHGLVHGNLEPRNVILQGGDVARPVLMGFGLMRGSFGWKTVKSSDEIVEVLQYVSPEQARGEGGHEPASDVFALGCVLFECLTGRAPFEGAHAAAVLSQILHGEPLALRELRPELPAVLEPLLQKMLAREPEHRYPGGDAVVAALAALALPAGAERLVPPEVRPRLPDVERQLVGLVLAQPSKEAPALLSPAEIEGLDAAVRELVQPCQCRLERLHDGSLLVRIWQADCTATDLAVQAVQLAVELRDRLLAPAPALPPDLPAPLPWSLAVTMGRMTRPDEELAGQGLRRAVASLQGVGAGAREPREPLWLDELTAGLVDTRYHVHRVEGGWTVTGRRRGVDEARTLLGQATPCVGREQELEFLEAALNGCIDEATASATLVLAPSGMGKSRLRQEFLLRLSRRTESVEVLLGYGEPRRAAIAYGLLAQAVLDLCGIRPGGDPAEDRGRLVERVGRHVEPGARQAVVEFVGELCGVPFPDEDSPRLHAARQDPRLMNERITEAMVAWFERECAVHPVLLVLEDLHWGDAATVRLVDVLLAELAERPLWVLALARPEIKELFPSLWPSRRVQELRLGALGRKASEQLAREVLPTRVPDALIERIVLQAQGHALFLEELIRAAAEGTAGELPETVAAMLQARFARLSESARRVLWAASLFGETFWRGGVAAVLGEEATSERVEAGLAALVQAEGVTRKPRLKSRFAGEEEFAFRHALVRDAAYALLEEEHLRTGHARAGLYLEQRDEPNPRVVAEHYERGGAHERAVTFYLRAAGQAAERLDYQGLLECVERGVTCGATGEALGDLRALQSAAEMYRWNIPAALAASQQALELLEPGRAGWYRAIMAQLGTAGSLGLRDVVLTLGPANIDTPVPPGAERMFMESAVSSCIAVVMQGQRELTDRLLERVEGICTQLGPKEVRAQGLRAVTTLWPHMLLEGDAWRHLITADAGIACFEMVGDAQYGGSLYAHRGLALGLLGQQEAAMVAFRTAVDLLGRINEVIVLAVTYVFQAIVQAESHAPEALAQARALAEQLIAQSPAPTCWTGLATVALSGALLDLGQLQAAENAARQLLGIAGSIPVLRPVALALLARSLLAQGQASAARAAAEEGLGRLAEQGGTGFMDIKLLVAAAEARRATGDPEGAREVLTRAEALLEQRAAQMEREQDRRCFLEQVKDHARVRELMK
ncbi:MAG TPA: protein kinase [Polyangia bacterium]|nr:protein kinase [Polyangia bacterium]